MIWVYNQNPISAAISNEMPVQNPALMAGPLNLADCPFGRISLSRFRKLRNINVINQRNNAKNQVLTSWVGGACIDWRMILRILLLPMNRAKTRITIPQIFASLSTTIENPFQKPRIVNMSEMRAKDDKSSR